MSKSSESPLSMQSGDLSLDFAASHQGGCPVV